MQHESLRADELVREYQWDIHQRTDRLFAGLMAFQWMAGIGFERLLEKIETLLKGVGAR